MTTDIVNFAQKLSQFPEHWSQRVVAEIERYQLKLVKLQVEFVWHHHEDTDEVFMVVKGEMEVGFRDRIITIRQDEVLVIPRGVEHITRAANEGHALIIEPCGVVNTGDAGGALTARNDVWLEAGEHEARMLDSVPAVRSRSRRRDGTTRPRQQRQACPASQDGRLVVGGKYKGRERLDSGPRVADH